MDKIKKITKMKLFLPIFSMILVMMINVIYDIASGNAPFSFFSISINNGILYGRLIDVLNRFCSFSNTGILRSIRST